MSDPRAVGDEVYDAATGGKAVVIEVGEQPCNRATGDIDVSSPPHAEYLLLIEGNAHPVVRCDLELQNLDRQTEEHATLDPVVEHEIAGVAFALLRRITQNRAAMGVLAAESLSGGQGRTLAVAATEFLDEYGGGYEVAE